MCSIDHELSLRFTNEYRTCLSKARARVSAVVQVITEAVEFLVRLLYVLVMTNIHPPQSDEQHSSDRISWLRASVLGANDGVVSTASLVIGVAAANGDRHAIMISGIAGLVAGAMSMAAGEYVSVSSQADVEAADLAKEREELEENLEGEHEELAQIYVGRGLDPALARQVSRQLMAHDALGSHARDELGITESLSARPVQAAMASAASFFVGAAFPLITVLICGLQLLIPVVSITSLLFLVLLGVVSARAGGASVGKATFRVVFWGALAMAVTAGIGAVFGTVT
jgi:VIT1/CCC1 family predicted Fe2+/Mn2+ transporter